jgi:hypothetical protein
MNKVQCQGSTVSRSALRLGCLVADAAHVRELAQWAHERSPELALDTLEGVAELPLPDILIADAAHAGVAAAQVAKLGSGSRPEVVLVGLSSLAALRIKEQSMPLALEVPDRWSLHGVVAAIEQILAVRMPLRALCREIVGCLDMPDALALLRYHMLSDALARAGTKRAAAKLLGVTRPAVQQMAKGYALPAEPLVSQPRELQTS